MSRKTRIERKPDPVAEAIAACRSNEWNGLRRGDIVRVRGMRGRFRFLFHHRDERQEYVNVYGPEGRPGERSFPPDRIKRR